MFERAEVVGTMSAQVARILGMRIVSGEYRPGSVLPIEPELCAAFGVSRTTVREAVKHLASKRLLEALPKVGTRVLPFDEWNLLDRDVLGWRLLAQFDHKIVADIFEMRLCFEPRASALAAEHGTADDFAMLAHRLDGLRAALAPGQDTRLAAQGDLEFHLLVINMSRNGMFITIGGAIKAALRVSSEMLHRHPDQPGRDPALYAEVARHITARHSARAADAMTVLLQASRDRLLTMMAKS
ncbi:FadR/GntR family transcriptional regulator [Rhizobacter sp. Root1221]|uniref:FadR/GntR family transcriptional regulator n=1 Tax=Rhizobacter sp. Root1221 TaxID=1736433 RepID=UPI0006FC2680|nr:FadR/GntR family transcriptional regulator [Rhizobacter sp. Root1221]KQV92767.1 GntR family transcriptional regulator [Rhizobacter sp. Root1221]